MLVNRRCSDEKELLPVSFDDADCTARNLPSASRTTPPARAIHRSTLRHCSHANHRGGSRTVSFLTTIQPQRVFSARDQSTRRDQIPQRGQLTLAPSRPLHLLIVADQHEVAALTVCRARECFQISTLLTSVMLRSLVCSIFA